MKTKEGDRIGCDEVVLPFELLLNYTRESSISVKSRSRKFGFPDGAEAVVLRLDKDSGAVEYVPHEAERL